MNEFEEALKFFSANIVSFGLILFVFILAGVAIFLATRWVYLLCKKIVDWCIKKPALKKKESLSEERAIKVVLSDVPFEVKLAAMQSSGMVPPDGYNPITKKVEK